MGKSAEEILDKWVRLVNTLDVDSIVDMYSDTAQLLPTFSSKTLSGKEGIRTYFKRFEAHSSVVVSLHPKSLLFREIGDGIYIASGLYCWKIDMDDELLNFEARFSFVLKTNDDSPIHHHHSSQIPRSI